MIKRLEHGLIDKIFMVACAVPFFSMVPPGAFTVGLNPPSVFFAIWFGIVIALSPFGIKFGPMHVVSRLLLILSSIYHVLTFFRADVLFDTGIVHPSTFSLIVGMSALLIYFQRFSTVGTAYMQLQNKILAEEIETARKNSVLQLDKPFYILNLGSEVTDLSAVGGIKNNLASIPPDFCFISAYAVRGKDETHLRICKLEDAEFFLVGISFTGFELIIVEKTESKKFAEAVVENLKSVRTRFIEEAKRSKFLEKINFWSLKMSDTKFEIDTRKGSEFFEDLHKSVREDWLLGKYKIAVERSEKKLP